MRAETAANEVVPGAVTITALEYLRVIHRLELQHEVAMPTRIAQEIGVAVASATNMCKRLARQGLVDRKPRKGVVLTTEGRCIMDEIRHRRHLLMEFMVHHQGLSHEHAGPEADRLSLVASTWFCAALSGAGVDRDASDLRFTI